MAKIKEKIVRFDRNFGFATNINTFLTRKTTPLPESIIKKQGIYLRLAQHNIEALCISVQFALVRGIISGEVQEWEGMKRRIPPQRAIAYLTDRNIGALDPTQFTKLNNKNFSRSARDDWHHDFEEMVKAFVKTGHYKIILEHVCNFSVPQLERRGSYPQKPLSDDEIRPYILGFKEIEGVFDHSPSA